MDVIDYGITLKLGTGTQAPYTFNSALAVCRRE
jgi:hypothetical protein